MRILLLCMTVISFLMNGTLSAEKLIEHEKSTNDIKNAIKVSPSKENLLTVLPDISKNLTNGEVIVSTEKGNDGKYTLFYSSISGGAASEVLSGEREIITKKMFKSVGGMKPGDWMGYDFTYTKDGKSIPMKAHIFPVTENIISVLVWPISGLSADISFGMEMAKVAPPTSPVAAVPLISPAAPMQQVQAPSAQPADASAQPAATATSDGQTPAAAAPPPANAEAVPAEGQPPAPAPADPAATTATPADGQAPAAEAPRSAEQAPPPANAEAAAPAPEPASTDQSAATNNDVASPPAVAESQAPAEQAAA